MSDRPTGDNGGPPEEGFRALLSLHAIAGGVDPSRIPGFSPLPLEDALRVVAEAPVEQIPVSARLEALHDLAKRELPEREANDAGYRALAQSVARGRVDPDALLAELADSARTTGGFQATSSRRLLDHRDAAFVGQDVCTTRRVTVDGLDAVWVFSEFETDAGLDHVAKWLDPRNWPVWGPSFFKRMEIVGTDDIVPLPPLGTEHWQALFREVVQFPWRQLNTLLNCVYWRDADRAAGMTYELNRSIDSQIDVDRGFILVNQVASMQRVKVLKLVGFTEDVWDYAAEWVCPFWTDWIRGAVEGGGTSAPMAPSNSPGTPASGSTPLGENLDAWMGFFGDSARPYLDLLDDVTTRVSSSGFSPSACLEDDGRYWSMLAKDWANAWSQGLNTLERVGREGIQAAFAPPGGPHRGTLREAEATTIALPGLKAGEQPVCSDLVSIGADATRIASRDIRVTVQDLGGAAYAARVQTTNTTVGPGLYVGQLQGPTGGILAPVQLYVSRARGA